MFSSITTDISFIKKLSDRPGEDGMTADEIKAEFDKGVELLKEFINEGIVEKLNTGGSGNIGSAAIAGISGSTVYDQLVSIKERLPAAGTILLFAGSVLHGNVLLCNGSAISRTAYAALFSAIGTLYGNGNGSTTFNLPNLTSANPSANIRYVIVC